MSSAAPARADSATFLFYNSLSSSLPTGGPGQCPSDLSGGSNTGGAWYDGPETDLCDGLYLDGDHGQVGRLYASGASIVKQHDTSVPGGQCYPYGSATYWGSQPCANENPSGHADPFVYNTGFGAISGPMDIEVGIPSISRNAFGSCFDMGPLGGSFYAFVGCMDNTAGYGFYVYSGYVGTGPNDGINSRVGSCYGYGDGTDVVRVYSTNNNPNLYNWMINGGVCATQGPGTSYVNYVTLGNAVDLSQYPGVGGQFGSAYPPRRYGSSGFFVGNYSGFWWTSWQMDHLRIFQDSPQGHLAAIGGQGVGYNGQTFFTGGGSGYSNNPTLSVGHFYYSNLSSYYGGQGLNSTAGAPTAYVQGHVQGSGWWPWAYTSGSSTGTAYATLYGLHGCNTLYTNYVDADGNTDDGYQAGQAHQATACIDAAAPQTPGTPSAGAPATSVPIAWNSVSDNADSGGSYGGSAYASGVAGYQVQWTGTQNGATGVVGCCSWSTGSGGLPNGTYQISVRALDNAGNWGNWSPSVSVQVGAPPTTSISGPFGTAGSAGWWKTATVNITCVAGSSACSNMHWAWDSNPPGNLFNGGTYNGVAAPSGAHTMYAYSTDISGRSSGTVSMTLSVDGSPPTTTLSASGTAGNAGWYRGAVNVSASCVDNPAPPNSGCNSTTWSVDGVNGASLNGILDGHHTITAASTDRAGNVESPGPSLSVNIDTTPPLLTGTVNPAGPNGTNGWYTIAPTFTLSCSDAMSGCGAITRVVNGAASSYAAPFALTDSPSTQTVTATVSDIAGNAATSYSWTGKVDTTPPALTGSVSPVAPDGSNGWYKSHPTFTLSCSDAASGCGSMTRVINGASTTYSAPVTLTDSATSQTVSGSVSDLAGNAATPYSWSGKIDSTAPNITTTVNPANPDGSNNWYITSPTVTGGCTDAFSGAGTFTYQLNGGSAVPYTNPISVPNGSWTITFSCTSVSGVQTARTVTVKVDTGSSFTGPLLTTPNNGASFAYPAGQTITYGWNAATDPYSGIAGYHITISRGQNLSSPTVDVDNGTPLAYGPWAPPLDGTWWWNVRATTNAGQTVSSTNGPFSFSRLYNVYNPPLAANLVPAALGYSPYPTAGPITITGLMAWLRGRPLDVILSANFTGTNPYGTWTPRGGGSGGVGVSATITGYHYYRPTGSPVAYAASAPVLRIDRTQQWATPGNPPGACALGNNYCIAWTIDLSVTYDDGVVIQWTDIPRSNQPGQYVLLPAQVQYVAVSH